MGVTFREIMKCVVLINIFRWQLSPHQWTVDRILLRPSSTLFVCLSDGSAVMGSKGPGPSRFLRCTEPHRRRIDAAQMRQSLKARLNGEERSNSPVLNSDSKQLLTVSIVNYQNSTKLDHATADLSIASSTIPFPWTSILFHGFLHYIGTNPVTTSTSGSGSLPYISMPVRSVTMATTLGRSTAHPLKPKLLSYNSSVKNATKTAAAMARSSIWLLVRSTLSIHSNTIIFDVT